MTKEFKTLAEQVSEKCDALAELLEDMVYMVESEDESLEDSGIDLQQISECLENVYSIREVFDAIHRGGDGMY